MSALSDFLLEDLKDGEESAALNVVRDSFNKYVAPGYSEAGIKEFFSFANPDALKLRLKYGNFMLVAKKDFAIVGVIEVKNYNHICLLFVKEDYHGLKIAKRLFQMALVKCKEFNPNLDSFHVNSSPYAKAVYEKLGFIAIKDEHFINGMHFIAMSLKI